MALIVFTLTDSPEGEVEFKMLAEPMLPMKESAGEPTPAQEVALVLMAAAVDKFSGRGTNHGVDDEDEPLQTEFDWDAGADDGD